LSLAGVIRTDKGSSSGAVDLSGASAIVLAGSLSIVSDANGDGSGGSVTLSPTVNGTSAGGQALSIVAGNGAVSLGSVGAVVLGSVGVTVPLKSLTIQRTAAGGPALLKGSIITDDNAGSGNVSLGPVVLGGNVTINTDAGANGTGGSISLAGVDGSTAGGQSLALHSASGTISLGSLGAGTALGGLSIIAPNGPLSLAGVIRTDKGSSSGAVDLSGASAIVLAGSL